jgi:hypothetical protein
LADEKDGEMVEEVGVLGRETGSANRATATDPAAPSSDNPSRIGRPVASRLYAASVAIAQTVIASSTSVPTIRSSVDGPRMIRTRAMPAAAARNTAAMAATTVISVLPRSGRRLRRRRRAG